MPAAHGHNRDLLVVLILIALGALSGGAVMFAAELIWRRVFS